MKVQMLLRLPSGLKEKLQGRASQLGVSLTGLILNILWEYLETKKCRLAESKEDV